MDDPLHGSETILVAEDERQVLDFATNILREARYTVFPARNGEEGLSILENHAGRIDLLLTDIIMPGMSGGELVRRMRMIHPELRVLYMSGFTQYTVVSQGILESVSPFIWKPFSPRELLRKVREVLESPPDIA